MAIALAASGVAFAAIVVWLGVRIFNRRERWAKWTLVIMLSLPVLYAASFGPACWISSRTNIGASAVSVIYQPILRLPTAGPETMINEPLVWYAYLGAADGWDWAMEPGSESWDWEFTGAFR